MLFVNITNSVNVYVCKLLYDLNVYCPVCIELCACSAYRPVCIVKPRPMCVHVPKSRPIYA